MNRKSRFSLMLVLVLALSLAMSTVAFADTDGTEPKITQQPDQLILQLGARWAGVEFELRTDAGIFPVPVVVDESGVLRMDLGGSTTYTLSCVNSTVPIPDPTVTPEPNDQQQSGPAAPEQNAPTPSQPQKTPLPLPAIIFFVGMAAAVAGLVALHISKKRREAACEEWDDEEDEP